jgi:hypothetical protein
MATNAQHQSTISSRERTAGLARQTSDGGSCVGKHPLRGMGPANTVVPVLRPIKRRELR